MANELPKTIPELLNQAVSRAGDQPALGTISAGQLTYHTWAEIDTSVRQFAASLKLAGIVPGDRVAQWAPNSYDWVITDLAILSMGAVHVSMHQTLSEQQVAEQFALAGAKLLLSEQSGERSARRRSPDLAEMSTEGLPTRGRSFFCDSGDLRSGACGAGRPAHSAQRPAHSAEETPALESCIEPSQLATLLFTSGTTGQPRGVMLSHENLVSNVIATTEAVASGANETRLCFLPLSHIYARTCDLYSWLYRGSRLVLAENRETIVRDCQLVKPQAINGVPYFYQKIAQQMQDAEPGALQQLLGGELKRCFCGGAAVAPEVEALFERQGLPLLSGYGLTEASPVVSATAAGDYQPGSVGLPLANLEVQLSPEGEVLVRGPSVMLGYWNDPQATQEAIVDGWLHTGDLGKFEATGHLHIVGRQKELIVLSTGKNVAPSRVEQCLAGSPLVEHVCVVGDERKYLGALIVPNPDALRKAIQEQRLWVWSRRRAVTHPKVREIYRREINRLLSQLGAEEQVGCFAILDRNFSVEQGELTAKLSLRRKTISANFEREIERMYAR